MARFARHISEVTYLSHEECFVHVQEDAHCDDLKLVFSHEESAHEPCTHDMEIHLTREQAVVLRDKLSRTLSPDKQ